jgi:hypothetical protein
VKSAEEGRIEWTLFEREVTAFSKPFSDGIEIFIQVEVEGWMLVDVLYN